MIRRKVRFSEGVGYWLLISQIEHARLSGWLASQCIDRFGVSGSAHGKPVLNEICQELLIAITHHDDGWRAWESAPQLDETGCPLSFVELALTDSLAIWNQSIAAAADIGPLAAWIVAGHFSALLVTSEHHAKDPAGMRWLDEMTERRQAWFQRWRAANEQFHTAELAGEALHWLQLFDVLSLWPCMAYPLANEVAAEAPAAYQFDPAWKLVQEIRPAADDANRMVIDPWPFPQNGLTMAAAAKLVPVREYATAADLLAASQPHGASWRLAPPRT